MKKYISLILLLAFLVLLAGCDESEQYVDPNGRGIEMSLRPVSATSATLVLTMHSDDESDEAMTDATFWIEKEENGSWERVPTITDNIVWYADTYKIEINTETEIPVDWSHLYGNLGLGKYRIGKEVLEEREPGISSWYTYYAEFEIVNLTC